MVYKPRNKHNWHDFLTADEAKEVAAAERVISECRAKIAAVAPRRAFIMNRAIQRCRYQKAARAKGRKG